MTGLPLFDAVNRKRPRPYTPPKPPAPKELVLHFSVAFLLRKRALPTWAWTHFPAGERHDKHVAHKLKQMGTQRGWPDFILVSPEGLLHALELKRAGEELSEDQEAFRDWCTSHNVPHVTTDTFEHVVATLEHWGVILPLSADRGQSCS